jgi:hypothetical protein
VATAFNIRFFHLGDSFSRNAVVKSRIFAAPAAAPARSAGSARHIRCSFASGPTCSSVSASAFQTVARYFALTFSAAAISPSGFPSRRMRQADRKYAARSVGWRR